MPSYNFVAENGDIYNEIMKFSEINDYLEKHPNVKRGIDTPGLIKQNLVSSKGVNSKPDNGFREVLSRVKEAHPKGNVNTF